MARWPFEDWLATAEATLRTVERLGGEAQRLIAALTAALREAVPAAPGTAWLGDDLARALGDVAGLQEGCAQLVRQLGTILVYVRVASREAEVTRAPLDPASLDLLRRALRETQVVLLRSGEPGDAEAPPSEIGATLSASLALAEAVDHERVLLAQELDASRALLAEVAARLEAERGASPAGDPLLEWILGRLRTLEGRLRLFGSGTGGGPGTGGG